MIFLAPMNRPEDEPAIRADTRIQSSNAAGLFLHSLLDGLRRECDEPVRLITAQSVGTWPKYHRRMLLPNFSWTGDGVRHHQIGCINLPFLKQLTRYWGALRQIRGLRGEKVLLCTTYMPFLWALQQLHPSNTLTVLVTDLPEYADLHQVSAARAWLRRCHSRMVHRFLRRADRFVLLTEQMAQPLNVGQRPWTVVEGIWQDRPWEKRTKENAILYSGRLNRQYGLELLLNAFAQMDAPDTELWLCGSGEMEQPIRQTAASDLRVRYFGFLDREQVWELQQRASVLVNPRQDTAGYTRYSFPSKTMEYLASGTPVLMYRLAGIPEAYDPYLNYVPGNTPAELARAMAELMRDETAQARAALGRKFVLEEKNPAHQARKILDLMG